MNTADGALPHSARTNRQASSVGFHFFLCLASFPHISLKANLLVRQRESCTCTPSQATHFKMAFNEWWVPLKMQSWQNIDLQRMNGHRRRYLTTWTITNIDKTTQFHLSYLASETMDDGKYHMARMHARANSSWHQSRNFATFLFLKALFV